MKTDAAILWNLSQVQAIGSENGQGRNIAISGGSTRPWAVLTLVRCIDLRHGNIGRICMGQRKINFSVVFAGQLVGVREVDNHVWQVSFMDYDSGYFDNEKDRVEPGPFPFVPDHV